MLFGELPLKEPRLPEFPVRRLSELQLPVFGCLCMFVLAMYLYETAKLSRGEHTMYSLTLVEVGAVKPRVESV